MQRAMVGELPFFMRYPHRIDRLRRTERLAEPLPDILHCQTRRMHQIIGIKPIVPQLVQQNLIRREIMPFTIWPCTIYHLVHRHQQRRFTELVLMQTVAYVSYGRDSEEPFLIGVLRQDGLPCINYLLDRQPPAYEVLLRQLMTVTHNSFIR